MFQLGDGFHDAWAHACGYVSVPKSGMVGTNIADVIEIFQSVLKRSTMTDPGRVI